MNYILNQPWDFYVEKLILILYLVFTYYALRTKIPLMPTQRAARKIILSVMQAEIASRPEQSIKFYDMGSGLGGLCFTIAKKFPQIDVVGLEMAWPAWLYSVVRQKLSRRNNVRFYCTNFWNHNISDGDIILFYLGYAVMQQMADKLRTEPRTNRLIISNTFPLPKDWEPTQKTPVTALLSKEIIVYRQA